MANATRNFLVTLAEQIAPGLNGKFKLNRTRLELKRPVDEGHDVVILSSSSKHSPYINVAFYYGKNYNQVAAIEKKLKAYRFPYHIQQYSIYRQPLYAPSYVGKDNWAIDIADPPPGLATEVVAAVNGMAEPFFSEFSSLRHARDCIAGGSKNCFSGTMFWQQLLQIDLALDDLDHFQNWRHRLNDLSQRQADDFIQRYTEMYASAV
jgi:hypothetical protein